MAELFSGRAEIWWPMVAAFETGLGANGFPELNGMQQLIS